MRIALLATAALAAAAQAQAADVYRSVDAEGNVSYSDRPVDATSVAIFIATPRPATPPPAVESAPGPAPAAGSAAAEGSEAETSAPSAAELAAQRAENCAIARERNTRYQLSRRLFRPLPDGEREYLSDAEIDAAKAAATADVEKWCN